MLEIKGEKFILDGKEIKIYSGAIHYFRTLPECWENRLAKLKQAGFNTVETYVAWNLHEPKKGVFNFEGLCDIEKFITIAEKLGLNVIVRPGPYICAEWDFGGLPAWLLADENMRLRCLDKTYCQHVEDFYKVLFGILRKHLRSNGGNIIAMQIENEYGSYGNDKGYLRFVESLFAKFDMQTLLFTSDGDWCNMLSGGTLPDVYKTLNFGSGAKTAFNSLEPYQQNMPKMCMEFWDGWFDHFGEIHHIRPAVGVINELKNFLDMDANFNFYMFHGGTNFNYWAGANHNHKYQPTVSSYDYSALLTECGDYTPAYHKVREMLLAKQNIEKTDNLIEPTPKQNVGKVEFCQSVSLMSNIDNLAEKHTSPTPNYMEKYGQNFGMILYHTTLKGKYAAQPLIVKNIHDKAYIFVDGKLKKTFYRNEKATFAEKAFGVGVGERGFLLTGAHDGMSIDILVDAMGRVNYGAQLYDRKGISNVRFGAQNLFDWQVSTMTMDDISKLDYSHKDESFPRFFRAEFDAKSGADCFVHMDNFTKGNVFVNGFNIGRYWKKGPQKALYIPYPLLKNGKNELVILEQEKVKKPFALVDDKPNLG
ncbi:MAG: beta-galactosidase [Clostridia bacterium]